MIIRPLEIHQAFDLMGIRSLVDVEGTMGTPAERQRALTLEFIESQLRPPVETFGAFADDNLVGAASLSRMPKNSLDPDSANWFGITGVLVHPNYRRNGIGKQLVLKCITRIQELGGHGILLDVYVPNPARAMYELLGFQSWNIDEGAYIHNGQRVDKASMRMRLNAS